MYVYLLLSGAVESSVRVTIRTAWKSNEYGSCIHADALHQEANQSRMCIARTKWSCPSCPAAANEAIQNLRGTGTGTEPRWNPQFRFPFFLPRAYVAALKCVAR